MAHALLYYVRFTVRIEYITVVVSIALAGLLSMGGLGGGFDHAIASEAASHRAATDTRAPTAYVTSAQAGVVDAVAHALGEGSAFRRLPAALQREAADAAALQDLIARANRTADRAVHSGSFTHPPESVANLVPGERARYFAALGNLERVAEAIVAHPELARAIAPESTLSYAEETLRTVGAKVVHHNVVSLRQGLVAEGSVRRAIRARAPSLGEPAIEQFMNWSREWMEHGEARLPPWKPRADVPETLSDAFTIRFPVEAALSALLNGNLLEYRNQTAFVVHPAERGFAIPLDDLPEAMRRWASVTDEQAKSPVIRHVMASNLSFLERQTAEHIVSLESEISRWGAAAEATRADLDRAFAYAKAHQDAVTAAIASPALSKSDVRALFAGSLGLNEHVPYTSYVLAELQRVGAFPLASETQDFWSYDRVVDWHALGTYPMEVPMNGKIQDIILAAPPVFANHDSGHLYFIQKRLQDMDHQASITSLRKVLKEIRAEGASADTAHDVKDALGYLIWEGNIALRSGTGRRYGAGASRILARWVLDSGGQPPGLEVAARQILAEIP